MAGLFRTCGIRFVWRCVLAVILAGSSLPGPVWAQEEDKISQEQLRSELQRFALQFESQMGEAVDILLASTTDPQRRRQLREARAFYLTDLLQMATGPIPEVNLLDMVVYTTLNRIVTEEDIVPNVLGESGERALDTLLRLEQDIWSLAARALSVEQQRELRGEIFDWRERNVDISYVNGVRIGDFSEQFSESDLLRTARRGFLLPEVNAATAAIDEVRLLAERMFFFTQSLPPIMRAFTELTYVGVLAEPETQQLLNDANRVSSELGRFNDSIERTTNTLEAASATFLAVLDETDADGGVTKAIEEARATVDASRELVGEVRETSVAVERVGRVADSVIDKVLLLSPPDTDREEARLDVRLLLSDVRDTSADIERLTVALDDLLGKVPEEHRLDRLDRLLVAIEDIDTAAGDWIQQILIAGVILIVVFLVGALVALLAYELARRRIRGGA